MVNGLKLRQRAVGLAVLAGLASGVPGWAGAGSAGHAARPTASKTTPPAAVRSMLQWVLQHGDNEGAPFAVIDKRQAHLWLFDAAGRAKGNTPVLLGSARGDSSVPGIGERPIAQIQPHERTTPAGRFIAERGHNANGEDIYWVDYDTAISMHRVRANKAAERRLQRLASTTAADNRISYGCINVPADFYDQAVHPLFAAPRPVVYLLPETMPMGSLFTPQRRTLAGP